MANQVGVVNTGHIQLRVSVHRREIGLIGLSVVIGENDAMFHFMLFPPELTFSPLGCWI
jgi:hypothetical protein